MKTISERVALFKRISPNDWDRDRFTVWIGSFDSDDDSDACIPDGYVRVTPYVSIEFPTLPPGPVVQKQIQQLDEAERRIREEFQKKLDSLADTRSKLLALTFQPAA